VILVKYCTRFTQEIFGLFVAAIFISEVGMQPDCLLIFAVLQWGQTAVSTSEI
jgi:hypothetical protein